MPEQTNAAMATGRPAVSLTMVPSESEWGSRNDRWRSDLFELRQRIERAVPDGVAPSQPVDGQMGLEWAQIIVDFAAAGVFTAAIEAMKAWLHEKPGRRAIEAEYEYDDNGTVRRGRATITADNIASNDVTTALGEVLQERG
jgi:hypothetical protein